MAIDHFISRLEEWKNQSNRDEKIYLMGLCLNEQIHSDIIPLDHHDKKLDYVITASQTYSFNS